MCLLNTQVLQLLLSFIPYVLLICIQLCDMPHYRQLIFQLFPLSY